MGYLVDIVVEELTSSSDGLYAWKPDKSNIPSHDSYPTRISSPSCHEESDALAPVGRVAQSSLSTS
jgi:hypothetical protein